MYGQQFNVITQGWVIISLIQAGRIVVLHFGVPCKSMTWARIPQLRSRKYLEGVPGLGPRQQALVTLGNELVAFTVQCCAFLHLAQGYFSIENPERSWLWFMSDVRMLMETEGIELVRFLFKDFGVPFYKPTLVLHNTPTLHDLKKPVAPWPGECITLRGQTWWDGQLVFKTKLAEPYPPALGATYGSLIRQALQLREEAQAREEKVPFAIADMGFWFGPNEEQAGLEEEMDDSVFLGHLPEPSLLASAPSRNTPAGSSLEHQED